MAMPIGVSMPPPTPWRTRNETSWPIVWAKPHSTEPPTNSPSAVRNTRFVPKRSPNHPLAGMHTASDSV